MFKPCLFKPCLLIPVYNHGSLIEATLATVIKYHLPCLLVDDGSDEKTARVLDSIAARETRWITLLRLPQNGGKGAAVLRGIEEAHRLGFSHALQLDADGQHNAEDIPAMLAMAEAEPDALISGAPQYDASVPKSRLYARYITHFWVWLETLSFDIRDTMCGFRVYPVAVTHTLAQKKCLGKRMDFDIEIMVRLYRAGTPVRFLETKVRYPEDGISHFKKFEDNVRISVMHTRLVCGMLIRLPCLLLQKFRRRSSHNQQHWSKQKESGSYWGMLISLWIYRAFGRRALYLLLYPIIGWYFLSNHTARIESRRYLQRVLDHPVRNRDIYAHFMAFGRYIVDRLSAWSGEMKHRDIHFENQALLLRQATSGRGAVILTSHLGSVEVCRALIQNLQGVHMNILAYTRNAHNINRILKPVHGTPAFEMIQITDVGPDTAIMLQERIQRGEFVVMTADRTSPTSPLRVTTAPFLGGLAAFSQGPFILASLLECPVYLLFVLPNSDAGNKQARYNVYLEPFSGQISLPRKQREELLKEIVTRYAARLEYYCRQAPFQWFNFFNFWQGDPSVDAPAVDSSSIPSLRK